MKSFKLVAFFIENKQGDIIEIPLEDSLIINQENEKNTWLIEVFLDQKYLLPFEEYKEDEDFLVEVIITNRENTPARFLMRIKSFKKMDQYASILMQGKLSLSRSNYAEKLLENLMGSGLTGDRLLFTFQEKMKLKKDVVPEKKG